MADPAPLSLLVAVADEAARAELLPHLAITCDIVATAATIDEVGELAVDLVPDVVLLDDRLDRARTGELCAFLVLHTPASRIVVLTDADDDMAYEALLQGAFTLVPNREPAMAIAAAVRGAARGESVVTAGAAHRLLEDIRLVSNSRAEPFARALRLTRTEEEVLVRLGEGRTPSAVASMHDVTPRLVNLHTGYAVAKVHHHVLRVRTRHALVGARAQGDGAG